MGRLFQRGKKFQRGKLFQGEIDRLVIFAGPGGSGKTSFLKKPEDRIERASIPSSISDFFKLAPEHQNIMQLHLENKPHLKNLCMHVDLTQPINWLSPAPSSRAKLLDAICPQIFSGWEELASYAERSSEVHVITLFVRQKEHVRRWVERELKEKPDERLRNRTAAVNVDPTHKFELHRKVYRAWQDYVEILSPVSSHIMDGNGANYSFVSKSDYEKEINTGYCS